MVTGPTPDSGIVPLLVHDHDVLKHSVADLMHLGHQAMAARCRRLVSDVTRHENAEERIVHRAIRTDVLPGSDVAGLLTEQEAEIGHLLGELEPSIEAGYDAVLLEAVRSRLLAHLRDEEQLLFPLLEDLEPDVRQWELGSRYVRAVQSAPSHPRGRLLHRSPGRLSARSPGMRSMTDRLRHAFRTGRST